MAHLGYASGGELPLTEIVDLYNAVGWSAYTASPQTLAAALRGSSTVVTARVDGGLVGLARVVSDGASICYLQDILVHPEHRRTGIGREMALLALEPYRHVRQKVLLTDNELGHKAFYESLGYEDTRTFGGGSLGAFVRFDQDEDSPSP